MRTRPATIATIVIALGFALTSLGLARALPFTVGGTGSRLTISSDLWAHGTAISPALVTLVVVGLLAAIAMRPTRGGRRAASWLAVFAGAVLVTGLLEPAQRDAILLSAGDVVLTGFVIAFHVGLIALILSCVGEARRSVEPVGPELVGATGRLDAGFAAAG